jgi:hypothetical protein
MESIIVNIELTKNVFLLHWIEPSSVLHMLLTYIIDVYGDSQKMLNQDSQSSYTSGFPMKEYVGVSFKHTRELVVLSW